ncbi:MAG: hypothetical protein ABIN96_04410 [Rubrivivax sp.]
MNHVLGGEPAATARLRPHTGARIELVLQDWPKLLPNPPVLAWTVTPAGLLQWCGPDPLPAVRPAAFGDAADATTDDSGLRVRLDASNPARLLARFVAGEPAPLQIDGNARLAGDVNWLIQNLRWDVAGDLERLFGPMLGHQLHQIGSALAKGLRSASKLAARGAAEASQRLRPRGM